MEVEEGVGVEEGLLLQVVLALALVVCCNLQAAWYPASSINFTDCVCPRYPQMMIMLKKRHKKMLECHRQLYISLSLFLAACCGWNYLFFRLRIVFIGHFDWTIRNHSLLRGRIQRLASHRGTPLSRILVTSTEGCYTCLSFAK